MEVSTELMTGTLLSGTAIVIRTCCAEITSFIVGIGAAITAMIFI